MIDQLTAIWNHRLTHVRNTEPVDYRPGTGIHKAVQRLRKLLGNAEQPIHFYDGSSLTLAFADIGKPINIGEHLRASLMHIARTNLDNFDYVQRILGYNAVTDMFRITQNKQMAFPRLGHRIDAGTTMTYVQQPWASHLHNMICQFDAPCVALYEYLVACGVKIPKPRQDDWRIDEIAEVMREILDNSFGVILFENRSILLDRPSIIQLDDLNLLSSTQSAAFCLRQGRKLFAVNGIRLRSGSRALSLGRLYEITNRSHLVATIEYLGWDYVMGLVKQHKPSHKSIDISKWGILRSLSFNQFEFLVVEVKNATPEKDGSYRTYFLPVDNECRPLPNPLDPQATMGRAQELTARNAVASTFGMTGAEYERLVGAHS